MANHCNWQHDVLHAYPDAVAHGSGDYWVIGRPMNGRLVHLIMPRQTEEAAWRAAYTMIRECYPQLLPALQPEESVRSGEVQRG